MLHALQFRECTDLILHGVQLQRVLFITEIVSNLGILSLFLTIRELLQIYLSSSDILTKCSLLVREVCLLIFCPPITMTTGNAIHHFK